MRLPLAHGGSALKCTDGTYLVFNTLCSLNARATSVSLAINPEKVDCKRCRKSLAWAAYLENYKERNITP